MINLLEKISNLSELIKNDKLDLHINNMEQKVLVIQQF